MRWKGSKDGRKEEYKRILRYRKGYGGIEKDTGGIEKDTGGIGKDKGGI